MQDKELYTPEFVPYYILDAEKYKMKPSEAIVYGFIRFFAKSGKKFSRSDEDLSIVLRLAKGTVGNAISSLSKKGAIVCDTKRYMTGSRRNIELPKSPISEQHLTNQGGATSPISEVPSHQSVRSNKDISKEISIKKETPSDFLKSTEVYKYFQIDEKLATNEIRLSEKNMHILEELYGKVNCRNLIFSFEEWFSEQTSAVRKKKNHYLSIRKRGREMMQKNDTARINKQKDTEKLYKEIEKQVITTTPLTQQSPEARKKSMDRLKRIKENWRKDTKLPQVHNVDLVK